MALEAPNIEEIIKNSSGMIPHLRQTEFRNTEQGYEINLIFIKF